MNEQEKKTLVQIPSVISVNDFANRLGLGAAKVISELMKNGVMATINEQIDFDTAAIIGAELGFDIELEVEEQKRPSQFIKVKQKEDIKSRPPVVAVMGHVDHGKTKLLDAIRNTDITSSEAGGITQHIGAYQVTKNERKITFFDTPGHEAFSQLREHGVKMTDVAIIVIAADDGVKPQTKEAIDFALANEVPIVVAINKIDKPEADVNKVKQQLSDIDLIPDDWGGDIPCVLVSAKAGKGIDKILDMVLLVADINEPKADYSGLASGVIIESHLGKSRGPISTALIQKGTLKLNDNLVAGSTYGKVKVLEDYQGKRIKEATPGTPARIIGLKEVPDFGDWFEVTEDEKTAKDWVSKRAKGQSIKSLVKPKDVSKEDISQAIKIGKTKELAVLIKADVAGSLESVTTSLAGLGNEEVRVDVVASDIGDINETDINTALAGNAIILGFNVSINAAVNQLAKKSKVEFRLYKVIYELLDDVKEWLTSLLEPEIIETQIGGLEILGIFKTTKDHVITGGKVTSGKITPDLLVKIYRDKKKIGSGKLTSLQKEKESAKEVSKGEQCGISVATTDKIEVGDKLVFYTNEQRARTL
ncbi:MAG: translation initiation factor IF-2 [bacterium]|nr:translation initiation factor IF-2 [bacterium]